MSASRLGFTVEATASGSQARAGRMQTLHSEVLTPLFMPVGTQATVKAQRPENLEDSGSQILLANTYHLLLRPGPEVFRKFGGYHGFTTWQRSVLTDSGGFQIFSLNEARDMSEEGAAFRSHLDGRKFLLSPELSIETQIAIGSDIMMVLDQCIPSTADEATARAALGITHRWAQRSLDARGASAQSLFGIVQGALFPELRRQSAGHLSEMPFDGFAIGGLAVGEEKSEREDICELTASLMPKDKPRYLMGVGTPIDILEAVHRGVDMFDCIIPTQVAQHGTVFSSRGIIRISRGVHRFSDAPLDPACSCPTCTRFPRAYLHHLYKAKEPLSWQLLGQHNIYFYHQLMREMRSSILEGRFGDFYREQRERLPAFDVDNPSGPKPRVRVAHDVMGAYRVHHQAGGFASIQHVDSGEIMHSHSPPMEEAQRLYIEQSRLQERLLSSDTSELIIWDVGLGAAANAMAAIACYEQLAEQEPTLPSMRLVSFENDLDSLRLALRNNRDFPYLRHAGPAGILRDGHWQSKTCQGLSWSLIEGDFLSALDNMAPFAPHLIFFDMFSSRSSAEQWSLEAFAKIYSYCTVRPCELFTYSCSTAIRASMLAAGFFVAQGTGTGAKTETTIAMTPARVSGAPAYHALLDSSWLEKWQRSSAKFPEGVAEDERAAFAAKILEHPQFRRES